MTAELKGVQETLRGMQQFERKVLRGLPQVADAMGKVGVQAAQRRVPRVSGDLMRSIESTDLESSTTSEWRAVGSDLPYARRIELGFTGVDSLGRHYNQPAQPYLRPLQDEARPAIVNAATNAARRIL